MNLELIKSEPKEAQLYILELEARILELEAEVAKTDPLRQLLAAVTESRDAWKKQAHAYMYGKEKPKSNFLMHLQSASDTVESWPAWKKKWECSSLPFNVNPAPTTKRPIPPPPPPPPARIVRDGYETQESKERTKAWKERNG